MESSQPVEAAWQMMECVPNFSEGRDANVVRAIEKAVGATLLDSTSDADHNRSVITLAGDEEAVFEAAFQAVRTAAERIDISKHAGVHPRTGAADVVPFVPLTGSTMDECISAAHRLGARVWAELGIPVYFYEAAVKREECARLENIRKHIDSLPPDIGSSPHPGAGVCIVGARKILIAWNINLLTEDVRAARDIARSIRESGGGFPALKALGLALPERRQVQVSMNLVDYGKTSPQQVFNRVRELCHARGLEIADVELIGLIPQAAWSDLFSADCVIENRLAARARQGRA